MVKFLERYWWILAALVALYHFAKITEGTE